MGSQVVTPVRGSAAREPTQGLGVVAHLEAEPAVDLEVDVAGGDDGGRHDLGGEIAGGGLAALHLLDEASLHHDRARHEAAVHDEASRERRSAISTMPEILPRVGPACC